MHECTHTVGVAAKWSTEMLVPLPSWLACCANLPCLPGPCSGPGTATWSMAPLSRHCWQASWRGRPCKRIAANSISQSLEQISVQTSTLTRGKGAVSGRNGVRSRMQALGCSVGREVCQAGHAAAAAFWAADGSAASAQPAGRVLFEEPSRVKEAVVLQQRHPRQGKERDSCAACPALPHRTPAV